MLYKQESIKLNPDWARVLRMSDCEEGVSCMDSNIEGSRSNGNGSSEIGRMAEVRSCHADGTLSTNRELFSCNVDEVVICLQCECVLIEPLSLGNHLVSYHDIVHDDDDLEQSGHSLLQGNECYAVVHKNDCDSDEVVFFLFNL